VTLSRITEFILLTDTYCPFAESPVINMIFLRTITDKYDTIEMLNDSDNESLNSENEKYCCRRPR